MSIAKVGDLIPEFRLQCIRAGDEKSQTVSTSDYRGRWLMLIFYPRDFTLVEMLTGRRAHADQSPVKLLVRLQAEDLSKELVREVDDAHRDLLLAMLAQNPEQRPSMSEVAGIIQLSSRRS